MSGFNPDPAPQFGKAEYVGAPGNDHCQYCHQAISGTYYRVNNVIACPGCVSSARTGRGRDKYAAYVRALAYGVGAAILGMIGYAALGIIMQGWVFSIVSIGVGWLVGTAMMKGSNGVGGRRYQITAALLTYAAVSTAAIPMWIHFANQRKEQRQTQQQQLQQEQRQLGRRVWTAAPAATSTRPSAASQGSEFGNVAGSDYSPRAGVSLHRTRE